MQADSVQRVAAAVTPAVMVSACALVALGLDNQAARVANRLRELAREYRDHPDAARRPALAEQMTVLERRHAHYIRALRLDYAALLLFVLTSLLYLVRGGLPVPELVPTAAFLSGTVLLAAMAFFVLASLRLSRAAIRMEHARTLATGET